MKLRRRELPVEIPTASMADVAFLLVIFFLVASFSRLEGTVVVDAIIRKDGTVSDVTTLKATNPIFAQSAIEAINQWRFTPSSYDVVLTVTVNFTLRK